MTYPSGMTVSYGHDGAGRAESLALVGATLAGNGSAQLITDVQYEPFGPVKRIDYGDGHFQARSFDQNYWISSISSTRNVGLSAYFEHDVAGNITRLSRELLDTGGGNGSDRNIDYDDLYRITEVKDRNDVLLEAYSYDATGNRLSKIGASGSPNLGSYSFASGSHRLIRIDPTDDPTEAAPDDGETRQHDAAGNLVSKQYDGGPLGCCGATYEYDHRNRMETAWISNTGPVQQLSYRYNGRGERVWRSAADGKPTLYVYDEAGRLIGEYNNTGGLISEVIWLDDLPVGVRRAGMVYPIEADHLGSPRTIHNDNTLLWHWDLLGPVFGEHAPNDSAGGSQFRFDLRFPGQQYDGLSGLHYNYFRDYEPGTGRYVQSDPIGLRGGLGTYGYVSATPLRYMDTKGRSAESPEKSEGPCSGGNGETVCNGDNGFMVVICNLECTRPCTETHEAKHVEDLSTFFPNSCNGKEKFESPDAELTQVQADTIECRATQAGLNCARSLSEECCKAVGPYIEYHVDRLETLGCSSLTGM